VTPAGLAAHPFVRRVQAQTREINDDLLPNEADEAFMGFSYVDDGGEYEGFDSQDNGQYDSDYSDSELDIVVFPDQEDQPDGPVRGINFRALLFNNDQEDQEDPNLENQAEDKAYDEAAMLEDTSTVNEETDTSLSDDSESDSLSEEELSEILDTQMLIYTTEASILMVDAFSLSPLGEQITNYLNRLLVNSKRGYRFFRTLEV
jgi:hypothetical protein